MAKEGQVVAVERGRYTATNNEPKGGDPPTNNGAAAPTFEAPPDTDVCGEEHSAPADIEEAVAWRL